MNEILIVLTTCLVVWTVFRLRRNKCNACGTRYFLTRARKRCERHHLDTAWMLRKFAEGERRRMDAKVVRNMNGRQSRAFNHDGPTPYVHHDYSYVRTEPVPLYHGLGDEGSGAGASADSGGSSSGSN